MSSRLVTALSIFVAACAAPAPEAESGPPTDPGSDQPPVDAGAPGTPDAPSRPPVDAQPQSATATTLLGTLARAECDQAHACKATFPPDLGFTFTQAFGATPAACTSSFVAFYDPPAVEAAITAGRIAFDDRAAFACVAALRTLAAPDCATLWDEGIAIPDDCGGVFVGTIAVEGSCTSSFECEGALLCESGACQ